MVTTTLKPSVSSFNADYFPAEGTKSTSPRNTRISVDLNALVQSITASRRFSLPEEPAVEKSASPPQSSNADVDKEKRSTFFMIK